jgi:hypothetical protein
VRLIIREAFPVCPGIVQTGVICTPDLVGIYEVTNSISIYFLSKSLKGGKGNTSSFRPLAKCKFEAWQGWTAQHADVKEGSSISNGANFRGANEKV